MGFCVGDGKLGALFSLPRPKAVSSSRPAPPGTVTCTSMGSISPPTLVHAGHWPRPRHHLRLRKAGFTRFGPKISSGFYHLQEASPPPAAMRGALARQFGDARSGCAHPASCVYPSIQAVQRGVRQLHGLSGPGSSSSGQQVTAWRSRTFPHAYSWKAQ